MQSQALPSVVDKQWSLQQCRLNAISILALLLMLTLSNITPFSNEFDMPERCVSTLTVIPEYMSYDTHYEGFSVSLPAIEEPLLFLNQF